MKAWVATSAAIVIKLFLEFFALYVPIDQLPRSDVENLFRDSLVSCPFSLVPDFSGANGAAVIDHPIGSKRFLSYRDVRWSTLVAKARYVAMLYNETAAEDIVDWLTEQALVFDLVKFDRIMKAGLIYLIVFVVSLMWLDTSESDLGSRKRAFFHAIAKILSREFHLFLHLRIIVSATFVGWSIRNESDEKNPLDSEFVIIWSILVFSVRTVLHMARCRLTEQVDHEAATAKTHDMFAFYRIASIALVCLTISSLVTTLPVMSGVLLSPLYRTFMLLDPRVSPLPSSQDNRFCNLRWMVDPKRIRRKESARLRIRHNLVHFGILRTDRSPHGAMHSDLPSRSSIK
ncbi:hypothetical protein L596_007332 [Steinernema carpocapsae]|uniref:Uncharacterized protein n=1 Tax=Steinernema carpocapsae TaxID=34508 RepID=A0A4U5P9N1_STECR|nr:hypothetical protein L596_007332 [Steinernema carpocapsae]